MNKNSPAKEQDKDSFNRKIKSAHAQDFFTAHEAACLWIEKDPESEECELFNVHLPNIAPNILDENVNGHYLILRSSIDKKIVFNSAKASFGKTLKDLEEDLSNLPQKGVAQRLGRGNGLISKKLLFEIAQALNEQPCFLFPDGKPAKTIDSRERNTLHLIIAALADKAKVEISGTNKDRVAIISRALLSIGVAKIADKTIRKHLDAAIKTANEKRE